MKIISFMLDKLYDVFEYLLMLIIVIIAVFIIVWRLDLMFGTNLDLIGKSSKVVENVKGAISPTLQGEEITISIPSNTSAQGIADILFEYELINDKTKFIESFGKTLGTKEVPSGSFTLKFGMTDEEIINILIK